MSINRLTTRKLVRENFTAKNPIKLTITEKDKLAESLKQRLLGLPNISLEQHHYYSDKKEKERVVIEFVIKDPVENYWYRDDFRVMLNETGQLVFYGSSASVPISDIEEIFAFIVAYQEQQIRQSTLKSKRQKVRDLKVQAIVAQLKKMGREEKFDFYTDNDTVKLKLYVRLTDRECIEIHIPFTQFQEILPNLKETIKAVRDLHNLGIRFKLGVISSWHSSQWITHNSL